MAERIRKPRTVVTKNTRTEVIEDRPTRSETEKKAIAEELDEMLEDIDGVLEQNAEEFVRGYVQKGGE